MGQLQSFMNVRYQAAKISLGQHAGVLVLTTRLRRYLPATNSRLPEVQRVTCHRALLTFSDAAKAETQKGTMDYSS